MPEQEFSDNGALPVVVVSCQIFKDLIDRYIPGTLTRHVSLLDYGLHKTPNKLKSSVQKILDELEQPSLVVLGYGLCGNGLDGLRSGKHILLVPRADDCIAILLGSYAAYRREFDAQPGTYYLTKGWLESGSNPLQEYQQYVQKYGEEQANWIMDQQYKHYHRLVLVAHTEEDMDTYRSRAQEVAQFCERWGMRYEEILGSDKFFRQLVATASELKQANSDFVVVQPGGELRQRDFIRIDQDSLG